MDYEALRIHCEKLIASSNLTGSDPEVPLAVLKLIDETKDIIEYKQKLIDTINFAIKVSDTEDIYTIGLRNGMRYTKSLIDGKDPEYEKCDKSMIPIDSPSYRDNKDYSVKD